MNKKELIALANKIEKFDNFIWPFGRKKSVSRYTNAFLVALLTLMLSPIIVIHFCDARCREMEIGIGIPLVIIAYLYTFYGRMPNKRWKYILVVIIWLMLVAEITRMYHIWIHGPNSP
jgi:small-conductance mechanosensitive channel